MSSKDRRSPSLSSIGSDISMISSSDDNIVGVTVKVPTPAFDRVNGEQRDRLNEDEGVRQMSPFSEEEGLEPTKTAPDVYPTHEHFYFAAENIYFLVRICHIHIYVAFI